MHISEPGGSDENVRGSTRQPFYWHVMFGMPCFAAICFGGLARIRNLPVWPAIAEGYVPGFFVPAGSQFYAYGTWRAYVEKDLGLPVWTTRLAGLGELVVIALRCAAGAPQAALRHPADDKVDIRLCAIGHFIISGLMGGALGFRELHGFPPGVTVWLLSFGATEHWMTIAAAELPPRIAAWEVMFWRLAYTIAMICSAVLGRIILNQETVRRCEKQN